MWMIRSDGGRLAQEFIERGVVSVGWEDMESLQPLASREQMIAKVQATWPGYKPMKAVVVGSQLHKFAHAIRPGDRVATYDPSARTYHLGTVEGSYIYDPAGPIGLRNQRRVRWTHQVGRDGLSVPTKNSLGAILTVFEVPEAAVREIDAAISGEAVPSQDFPQDQNAAVDEGELLEDLRTKAREFIKDRLVKLDWEEMQELVAGALRAMGYKTQVSHPGSDRGKDIIASPDGLGLEQPRIVVEVKHRPNSQMGSHEVRSFLGGRHKDDKGLYVSTGGFSKEARYEAERASIPLTLIDIDDLVELVLVNYEAMDMESRALLPLTKIWWPA
ncbi:MAG TPA: restriction endonuclease [Rhodospirillaceae bacterium]|jgi:restriction system protein|nr:restriction endonuclease [Alphaproteobacteria bacterium]HBH26247.1 restriction endonuclease [Rhodospirillaceae bacterium]